MPAPPEPEVDAFTTFLKQLFELLQTSLTRYAARCHRDKGTVSRYLSGSRIPPQDFVDNLLVHVSELKGQVVTEEVQQQARRLRLEALRVRNATAYELEVLRHRLSVVEEELHRAKVLERVLLKEVAGLEAEAARTQQRFRELEDQWTAPTAPGQELQLSRVAQDDGADRRFEELERELSDLRAELARAQELKQKAEQECQRLEKQLISAEARAAASRPAPSASASGLIELESKYTALLREVGRRIGTTPALRRTLDEVCTAMVPDIADAAWINSDVPVNSMGDYETGRTHRDLWRVACCFGDALAEWADLVPKDSAIPFSDDSFLARVLIRQEARLLSRISPAIAAEGAALLGDPDLVRWFAGCSALVLPLSVRHERTIGLLFLLRSPDRPPFDENDVSQLAQLAERSALSIENARLHEEKNLTASYLQRSMLPSWTPRIPGVQVAHRYASGLQRSPGGDWYDAIQLSGNRVALVVGDVMGHGLYSAATMGRFRTAVQTLTALDLPPGQVLRHLDNIARGLGPDHLATCLYGIYDPIRRTCTLAAAGHAPGTLVSPDGHAQTLETPVGIPLGIGGDPFEAVEFTVEDGSVLVLCTDGLVAVHDDIDIVERLNTLCGDGLDAHRDPEDMCAALLKQLHTENRRDDLALLVARFDGIHRDNVAQCAISHPKEVRIVRALVRDQLRRWGIEELVDRAQLLVSELAANALRVSTTDVGVQLVRTPDKLLVEVSDSDHNLPSLQPTTGRLDEHGRGLRVVSLYADRWGTSRKAVGKVVWFELTHKERAARPYPAP
jgi:serine phosphatase RsbU (regulator of sigma subunit)/anti-sigma regulatory factor (Ser/Thr protein kinase)